VLRSRGVRFEVVALDHASDDDSAAILHRLADARVRIVPMAASLPLALALEQGRALCRAPLVARMDADDVMHPDRLACDVAWLRARDDVDAVASCVKLLPKHNAKSGMRTYVAWQNASRTAADHARDIWIEQPVCQPATTVRTRSLDVIGGYRAGPFPEDYDLFLRMVCAGQRIEKRADVHHGWREHDAMSTKTHANNSRDAFAVRKAQALVQRFHVDERPVIVAGAGKEGGRIGRALRGCGVKLHAFVDVNPARIGRVRHDAPVLHVSELGALRSACVDAFCIGAVGASGARAIVRASLVDAGFHEGEDAVVVA
jgi:hypothetical protein